MPSETPNLQEIANDLEAQIHECCDSDDGDAVCHRCGVRMNAVDALRAAHQERDADPEPCPSGCEGENNGAAGH